MLLAVAACNGESDADTSVGATIADRSGDSLAEVIGDDPSVSLVSSLLDSTGIKGALQGEASYTLLAPTDAAVEALGDEAVATLKSESGGAIAAAILRGHMIPGALTPDAIKTAIADNGGQVTMRTFGSGHVTFAMDGETITVASDSGVTGRLTGSSINASNGALMPVDTVLVDTDFVQPTEDGTE